MTVNSQFPTIAYTGDGVQTTFTFAFRLLNNSDLKVFVDTVQQVENSDYTIENLTEAGGDVVFNTAPADQSSVVLTRVTSKTQQIDYEPFDSFPADTHELGLDKLTMITQELEQRIIDDVNPEVFSVFGRIGHVVADVTDYDQFYTPLAHASNFNNPHQVTYAQLIGKPSTFPPSLHDVIDITAHGYPTQSFGLFLRDDATWSDGAGDGASTYVFRSGTSSALSQGQLSFNNVVNVAVTEIYAYENNVAGENLDVLFGTVDSGDGLFVWDTQENERHDFVATGVGVKAGSVWTFPVNHVASDSLNRPNNGIPVIFRIDETVGALNAHVSDTDNPHVTSWENLDGDPLFVLDPLFVRRDGSTPLTANWDAGAFLITAGGFNIQGGSTYNIDGVPHTHPYMYWRNKWTDQAYNTHDTVIDGSWTMVANKDTTERAAPQPTGDPIYVYTGTPTTDSVSAKQIIQGCRYSPTVTALVTGYRVYVVTGNVYRILSVADPTGAQIITDLLTFEATVSEWLEFTIPPVFVSTGEQFDLLAITYEPDPTPTTFNGEWNYQTPNNPATPGPGNISHANRELDSFRINKTDDNGGDRSAELGALTAGDIIEGAGVRWAIQVITDNGTWIDYTVAPAQQGSPDGVQNFTFETVLPVPISYERDVDFWLGNATVSGLFGADVGYPTITPDDNQYSVDIRLQNFYVSPDWDVLSTSGISASGQSSTVESSATASGNVYASFYMDTGGVTGLNATAQTLVLNQERTPNVNFALAANEVLTGSGGDYNLSFDTYINSSASSRSEYSIWIERDSGGGFVEEPGTRCAIYARGYDSGQSASINTILTVAAGDKFRFRIQRTAGGGSSGYQDDNGTRLSINRIS